MEIVSAQPKVETCGHFSIRGFVAEVRKKDMRISWPFPCEEQLDVLPPIHVPDYKYWKCKSCLKVARRENVEEIEEVSNPYRSGIPPNGTCSHLDAKKPPSGVIPEKEATEKKGKEIKDGSIRKPRTKKINPYGHKLPRMKSCMDHEVKNPTRLEDDAVNVAVHNSEESDHRSSDDEIYMSRLGGTGKRKRRKVRSLGNIMSRCDEKGAASSSSGSGASLGIDLNLSPTHQMIKTKKRKDMGNEDEEFLTTSSQNNLEITTESSADGKRHTVGTDQTVSSHKKKGKMIDNDNGDSSSLTPLGENEYAHVQCDGTTVVPFKPPKGVQDSNTEAPSAEGRLKNNRKKNLILNGKFPENSAKRMNILEKQSGQRDKRAFKQNCNGASEQASLDDITMEIVELMAKNKLERRMGASEVNNCQSGISTDTWNDPNLTNKTEAEILKFLQEKKSQQSKLQTCSRPSTNNYISEQARALNVFSVNHENSFSGAPFPVGISSRNSGDQTPFSVQSSNREVGHQNSTISLNQENPSSGAHQVFLGASSLHGNCDYQISTFSKNQNRPSTGAQLLVASSSRTSSQNFTFSQNHEKPPTGNQLHASSSSRKFTDFLVGNRNPQICLQTSEAYQSQLFLWQNSCRDEQRVWPPMMPNCLPFTNSKPGKFGAESNTGSRISHCLPLFPKGNKNGNQSVKPTDAARRAITSKQLANYLNNRQRNVSFETCKKTHPEYLFSCRERTQPNSHSVRPVHLYNKELIPATDLLRLMDAGMCPSTPVNVDNCHKLSQQCSSYPDHFQLEKSRLGHLQNKEASSLPSLSQYLNTNHYTAGSFGGKFPPTPEVNIASYSAAPVCEVGTSSLLQNSEIIKMDPWFRRNPEISNDPVKVKANIREPQSQTKTSRFSMSPSGNDTSGEDQESTLNLNLQKGILSTPAFRALKDSTNSLKSKGNNFKTSTLGKISCREGYCSVNRNPAEITLPEAVNEYMTEQGDAKYSKKKLSGERTDPAESVGSKRQKKVRFAALKDV